MLTNYCEKYVDDADLAHDDIFAGALLLVENPLADLFLEMMMMKMTIISIMIMTISFRHSFTRGGPSCCCCSWRSRYWSKM